MAAIKTWALNTLKATPAFLLAHWPYVAVFGAGFFIGHKI